MGESFDNEKPIAPSETEDRPAIDLPIPQSPPPAETTKKSLKKPLLFSILILTLLAIAAVAYTMLGNDETALVQNDDNASTDADDSKVAETKVLKYFSEGQIMLLDEDNQATDSGEAIGLPTAAHFSQNTYLGPQFTYDREGGGDFQTYFIDLQLHELITQELTSAYGMPEVVSPDGQTAVYFEEGDDYPATSYITIKNIASSEETRLIDAWPDDEGPISPVGWLDDENVILRGFSCFECDGPPLPILKQPNIVSSELTTLVNLNDEYEQEMAEVYRQPENDGAVIKITAYGFETGYELYTGFDDALVYYDFESDDLTTLFEKTTTEETISDVVGWSEDFGSAIFTIYSVSEDPDGEGYDGYTPALLDLKSISWVNLDGGGVTNIPLEISELAIGEYGYPEGQIIQATIDDNRLIFVTKDPMYGEDPVYALKVLPLTGEEAAVETITTSAQPIGLLGFDMVALE